MNANTIRSSCAPIEKEAARVASSARFELRGELFPFGQVSVKIEHNLKQGQGGHSELIGAGIQNGKTAQQNGHVYYGDTGIGLEEQLRDAYAAEFAALNEVGDKRNSMTDNHPRQDDKYARWREIVKRRERGCHGTLIAELGYEAVTHL